MNRALILCLLGAAFLQNASAQSWPKIPLQPAPITIEEVKVFWFNHLPRPAKPRPLARHYKQQVASYQSAVHRGRQMITLLRNGDYDEDATIAVLKHNRDFYLKRNNHEKAAPFSRELTAILEARLAIAEAKAASRPPARPAPSPPQVVHVVEETYYQPEEEYCPPPRPSPPAKCPPPNPPSQTPRPPIPDPPAPKAPPHCPVPSK